MLCFLGDMLKETGKMPNDLLPGMLYIRESWAESRGWRETSLHPFFCTLSKPYYNLHFSFFISHMCHQGLTLGGSEDTKLSKLHICVFSSEGGRYLKENW